MKIKQFKASNLHGYLPFDFKFHADLTFLTGINGSGKTSVVNSIFALISPSIFTLAKTGFSRLEVHIEHEAKSSVIWCERTLENLRLGVSSIEEIFEINVPRQEIFSPTQSHDEEKTYYREQTARLSNHPVMQFLTALPTPMFLSIERRVADGPWALDGRIIQKSNRWRRNADVFSSLSRSLVEAASLAESKYREIEAKRRSLEDALRKRMILAALRYQPAFADEHQERMTEIDFAAIEANVDKAKSTLKTLGLPEKDITQQIDTFVQKFREISKYMPFPEKWEDLTAKDPEKMRAFVEWTINGPQIGRLVKIFQLVDRYVQDAAVANQPIDQYLEIVNRFLRDSGKELVFTATGDLEVCVKGGGARSITSLSSGESQLVVILTHLRFNPAAQSANVFIVDEPELSLHIRWQELFVDAVRTVNPQIQAILATHSPSIILDNVDRCIDLAWAGTANTTDGLL